MGFLVDQIHVLLGYSFYYHYFFPFFQVNKRKFNAQNVGMFHKRTDDILL